MYSYVAKGVGGKPGMPEEPEQAYFSDYVILYKPCNV